MPQKKYQKYNLRYWHRNIGLLCALLLVFMAVTGILINHADSLGFPDRHIQNKWLLKNIYGIEPPRLESTRVGDHWVSASGPQLFFDDVPVAQCKGRFLGAAKQDSFLVLACSNELLLATQQGELVDKQPAPNLSAFGKCASFLCVQNSSGIYLLDAEFLSLDDEIDSEVLFESVRIESPEEKIAQKIFVNTKSTAISWERFLLDLHAGRILGSFGTLLIDLASILFVGLSLTGVWFWWRRFR